MFKNIIEKFCTFDKEKKETFTNNVEEILGTIIDKAIKRVGKPVLILNKEDKLKIIFSEKFYKSGDHKCKE